LLTAACEPKGGGLPTCPTADLQAPIGVSPDHIVVPDLQPVFLWSYPEACNPEGYRVEISDYGSFDDADTIAGGTGNPSTTWVPADPLLPGTDYEWRAAAINGTTLGPYSQSTRFWTGPLCDAATLAAPTLGQPADGSVVANPFPPLSGSHTEGCVAECFSVHLSTDPGLGGASLMADFAPRQGGDRQRRWRTARPTTGASSPTAARRRLRTRPHGPSPRTSPAPAPAVAAHRSAVSSGMTCAPRRGTCSPRPLPFPRAAPIATTPTGSAKRASPASEA
jgi:hypothetical protein